MSDGIEPTTGAAAAAVTAGAGGFFWWFVRSVVSAREKAHEEFRAEMRASMGRVESGIQVLTTTAAVAETRHASLELRVASLERALERLSEGR